MDAGLVTEAQLKKALEEQRKTKGRLGDVLLAQGSITERQLIEALEFQLGIPHVVLVREKLDPAIIALVPDALAIRHVAFPLRKAKNRLVVAMADPLDHYAIDDLRMATGLQIEPVIASREEVRLFVDRYYAMKESLGELSQTLISVETENAETDLIQDESPVVRLVNQILSQAVAMKASDVHFDPAPDGVRVRFRVDGTLRTEQTLSHSMQDVVTARLKIISNLNIAERRLPQDGRIHMLIDQREVDVRVSTLPTIHGEKTVLRIIDQGAGLPSLDKLGFRESNLRLFRGMLRAANGIVLVTGPTGSGKSTTLYSGLMEVSSTDVNVITIEDPVESQIPGVNQVPVNHATGMTFAKGLRAILRQDPDILMVGEIRDAETAEIAIRAALTGHLVLSTLHTNGAVETISRLLDMGVEPFLVASALSGVVAQRLVRRVCADCASPYTPTGVEQELLHSHGITEYRLQAGRGCGLCGRTGYRGRVAVHEIVALSQEMRSMILHRTGEQEIRQSADSVGFEDLLQDGLMKAAQGLTTVSEVLRVISIS